MGCDCDAKKVDIVMRVLQGVAIILLIGNIAFVGYCMHQNKVQKTVKSYVYSNLIPCRVVSTTVRLEIDQLSTMRANSTN